MMVKADVLIDGGAVGRLLKLQAPICFWGGLDPIEGQIADPKHPDFKANISGEILAVPEIVGSSSSSQLLLEALRRQTAPAAIILGRADAIIAMAVLVGKEMSFGTIPILHGDIDRIPNRSRLRISPGGQIDCLK